MDLIFDVNDRPKGPQLIFFALQQMLAILAATIAVPMIIGSGLTPAAAMLGAGVGTIVYVLFTRRKSPVFLGSSFAFIGSMFAAFAGGVSMELGMLGLIIGAVAAGLVYVLIAALVKAVGVEWLNRLMPPVVIGPTVSIIGLSLAGNAIGDLTKGSVLRESSSGDMVPVASPYAAMICGLVTLAVVMVCSVYGKKMVRLLPFVIGILAGYACAALMTLIGNAAGIDGLKLVDYSVFRSYIMSEGVSLRTFFSVHDMVFASAFKGTGQLTGSYLLTVLVAYVPVALVCFAEHVADHKNLSSVIGRDLLKDPGLSSTLMGDGVGSIAGAFFGGCPNTTYGESVGCVAITRNASVVTIIAAAVGCVIFSFITPFIALIASIPSCVMGGVCIALYGFIAVSGLKMLKNVDLDDNSNLFTASVILIAGIGGLSISFGSVTITEIAAALILGILTNVLLSKKPSEEK